MPLIKKYLPYSLQKYDTLPDRVIKKGTAYMLISTKKLKYLDLSNYLAAGTSLSAFYKSYNVNTPKGNFCYEWFDCLEKLNFPGLPEQKYFFSTLTKSGISDEDYKSSKDVFKNEKMKTFSDYVRYYNNHDVIGMVEGLTKMIEIENKNGLDLFKISVSLPGLTQQYLFKNLKDDYFTNFSKEHEHIYKQLKAGVVGGASIIFHRHHKVDETKIKGKHL